MTTNKDWLFSLPLEEQYAWMNAEHVQQPVADASERVTKQAEMLHIDASDGDTAAQNADSRELILTDLEKKTQEWHDYDGNYMRIYSSVAYAQIKELLDRQAAITAHQWELYHNGMMREWMAKTVELQAQVDKLTAERDELTRAVNELQKKQPYCYDPGAPLDTLNTIGRYIDELTAERDNLADDLLIANKQREWYRKKFGKCIDYADAIHALMDDEGMA